MDIMYRSENETPSLPPELFNFHFFGNSYFVTENINKNDETYLRLFCSRQKIMLDHYVLFVMEKIRHEVGSGHYNPDSVQNMCV